jgi:hypothetical protein
MNYVKNAFILFMILIAINLSEYCYAGLPMNVVFRGEEVFYQLVRRAERERWAELPIGERTACVARALLNTPYVNYTLELDDHIEAPSVNFYGMDCWTFFEISLGFSRMLRAKAGNYEPRDLLGMIELERYRGGRCTGSYLSRLHHLEDWIYDNAKRGLVIDMTRALGNAERMYRQMRYMGVGWRKFRYLRSNPDWVPKIASIEAQISSRPTYHIPKTYVPKIEDKLREGDVICITTTSPGAFTSHVGLAYRDHRGVLRFMHASKKHRKAVIDSRLSDYLLRNKKQAGIMVARPLEVGSRNIRPPLPELDRRHRRPDWVKQGATP